MNFPPQWRTVFAIRASEDGRRFFYPEEIDNTKPNYCADIYCYDMTHKNPEVKKIDTDINNYTINQDGSRVFYLKDKSLYVSDLSRTRRIADDIDKFFINKMGDRLMYLTSDSRLFHYTGGKAAKEIVSGITLQYVSVDLNMIYYLKDKNLYLLKDGKDVSMIDSGVITVSSVYDDGSLYYLKSGSSDIEIKSLYFYSNGQSAKISEYCESVWADENHIVSLVPDSPVSCCGSNRPLLVYSQLTSDKKDNVEICVCSGSKVLGKLGDIRPVRVEYDTKNNKIYYAISPKDEKPLLYDLYCAAIDGETSPEVRKYAEGVNTGDILFGGNVVYMKSESNSRDGDLYVNNIKVDSFSSLRGWGKNNTNSFTYAGNISRYDHSFTLKLYKDGKATKLAEKISNYICNYYENGIAYLALKTRKDRTGQLYLYNGSQADRLIDAGVSTIIETLEPQYYSYWDDQPTYDTE